MALPAVASKKTAVTPPPAVTSAATTTPVAATLAPGAIAKSVPPPPAAPSADTAKKTSPLKTIAWRVIVPVAVLGTAAYGYVNYVPSETREQHFEFLSNQYNNTLKPFGNSALDLLQTGGSLIATHAPTLMSRVFQAAQHPVEKFTNNYLFNATHPFQDSTPFAQGSNNLDESYIRSILNIQIITTIAAVASKGISALGRIVKSRATRALGYAGSIASISMFGLASIQYLANVLGNVR